MFLYICRDNLEDPLDDTATVFQQLEQLCTVSRCEYEKTCTLLVQLFDQNAQNYQKLLHSASGITVDMAIQEGQWILSDYYMVCVILSSFINLCSNFMQVIFIYFPQFLKPSSPINIHFFFNLLDIFMAWWLIFSFLYDLQEIFFSGISI